MAQFVVFLIFQPAMASVAEILWTRLGNGYTSSGGGFSHYLAGRSYHSALKVTQAQWAEFADRASRYPPFVANTIEGLRRIKHAEREHGEKTRLMDNERLELEAEIAGVRKVLDLHGKSAKISEADSVEPEGPEADCRAQLDEARDTLADLVETMAFVGAPKGDRVDD